MVINTLSGIIIIGAILVIALRVLTRSGMPVKENVFFNTLLADKRNTAGFIPTRKETATVFGVTFFFKIRTNYLTYILLVIHYINCLRHLHLSFHL